MKEETQKFTNNDLAAIFERIARLLEIKGEVVFKIRAYQKAAESLQVLGEDINTVAKEGRLEAIPGVGKAIAEKIQELLSTGSLDFLERLEEEVPPSLMDLLEVPDFGPRKTQLVWQELGVTDLPGLEAAAKEGKLRKLPGMGEKSEARVLAGIAALSRRTGRMTLGTAWNQANRWLEWLREQPGVLRAEPGGSLRRWKETIGDLDLVAVLDEEQIKNAPPEVMENFIHHPEVERILAEGDVKSSVELKGGVRIQLWVTQPERFGSMWVYATGSKAHNVRLRELAQKENLSLSDRGIENPQGKLQTYSDEVALYKALKMDWIPPMLREDRGEIEAALKHKLPELVSVEAIHAELHAHSRWSDGALTILEMARAAKEHGLTMLAITDHSDYLGVTGGLSAEQIPEQRKEIDQAQKEMGDDFKLLQGIEVDIKPDGTLALPDEALAQLDLVIASLHVSLRQPREQVTERLLNAIHNPYVDIIAHPSGRLLPNREGADLDWEAVLKAAAEQGLALEINASPSRLDLIDVYAHRAIELGIPLTIDTDAHSAHDLDLLPFGVAVARRAWAGPQNIINAWQPERIVNWLKKRG